jgi:hypothetical protein
VLQRSGRESIKDISFKSTETGEEYEEDKPFLDVTFPSQYKADIQKKLQSMKNINDLGELQK